MNHREDCVCACFTQFKRANPGKSVDENVISTSNDLIMISIGGSRFVFDGMIMNVNDRDIDINTRSNTPIIPECRANKYTYTYICTHTRTNEVELVNFRGFSVKTFIHVEMIVNNSCPSSTVKLNTIHSLNTRKHLIQSP